MVNVRAAESPSSQGLGQSQGQQAWLLPLFVGSGCAALIYEIVWFQSLQLVVGASAVSLGVLLATFMGGMCLGSIAFPFLVPRRWHPLKVYAALELLIGLMAIAILFFLPSIEALYVGMFAHGNAGSNGQILAGYSQANVWLRAGVAGMCLLPPTVLMGATLPAISRWFESNRQGAYQTGLFCTANIIGAVIGCLAASFYLLRLYDMVVATYAAVAINVTVAAIGLIASHWLAYDRSGWHGDKQDLLSSRSMTLGKCSVYVAIALSGFAALGAEVVWTRELSLLLGASVYTFSLILAVFLVALGIGSSVGAGWARRSTQPALAFATCQLGAAFGVAWAAWMMAHSLPYWPIDASLSQSPWHTFQLDIVRVAWAVFPAALFWGCSFPLALSAAANHQDPAKLVAGVYAANTLGAIGGAIGTSWFAIPMIGIQHTHQLLLASLLLSAGCLVFLTCAKGHLASRLGLGLAACGLVVTAISIPKPPVGLAAYGRFLITWTSDLPDFLYAGDGLSASIAVSEMAGGIRNFHVSGKVVASSEPQDMRLQRLLGHLPALMCEEPKSVLIVGCGAGVTAGSFVVHPSIERIVICEIEPLIPQAAGEYFASYNHSIISDPRLEIVLDDARHFMLTTDEKFDIITSDPIHPWVKGAAALYSKEYFDLCREHLKPGGIATQWVPLYESSLDAVKSEVATFFESFPEGTIWANDDVDGGYDLVMLGQAGVTHFDLDAIASRLARDDHARVYESLAEVGLNDVLALAKNYGGSKPELAEWLSDAVVNTDRNLRLQYSAGWALNSYTERYIRASMQPYIKYPEQLFSGRPMELNALKYWIERQASEELRLK
ncbi:MAG: fused MFS/spermidine synthase [Pirellulaceae bacterium]